jgi:hypothetical protein
MSDDDISDQLETPGRFGTPQKIVHPRRSGIQ